jgi:hypothetical protein
MQLHGTALPVTHNTGVTLNVDCVKVTQTLSWTLSIVWGTAAICNTPKTGSSLQVHSVLSISDTLYRQFSFTFRYIQYYLFQTHYTGSSPLPLPCTICSNQRCLDLD